MHSPAASARRRNFEAYMAEETKVLLTMQEQLKEAAQAQRSALAQELAQHNSRVRQLVYSIDDLQLRHNTKLAKLQATERRLDAAEAELASSTSDARVLEDRVIALSGQVNELQAHVAKLARRNGQLIASNQSLLRETAKLEASDTLQAGRAKASVGLVEAQKRRLVRTNAAMRVQSVVRRTINIDFRRKVALREAAQARKLKAERATSARLREELARALAAKEEAEKAAAAAKARFTKFKKTYVGDEGQSVPSGEVAGHGASRQVNLTRVRQLGVHQLASWKLKLGNSLRRVESDGSEKSSKKSKKSKKAARRRSRGKADPFYIEDLVFAKGTLKKYPNPKVPDDEWLPIHNEAYAVQSTWALISGNTTRNCLSPCLDRGVGLPEPVPQEAKAQALMELVVEEMMGDTEDSPQQEGEGESKDEAHLRRLAELVGAAEDGEASSRGGRSPASSRGSPRKSGRRSTHVY